MKYPLRRCGATLVVLGPLAAALAGCATAESAPRASHRTDVPRPDLCKLIERRPVAAAVQGKITDCEQAATPEGYSATFSGRSALAGRKLPATLVIGYTPRYDRRGGADRWTTLGRPSRTAVPMIGVGDYAIFDATAAKGPQLVAVAKDIIVSVEVRIDGASVPQRKLPESLMDTGRNAVTALG